jgi:diaminohydroxyphosphoribosylaminopyrimidine deaminase / 5-amino-6-(5-phosphoribosylamino)uracil reductase
LFLKQNIRKVVIGVSDPNPLVAGRGIEILKNENIDVEMVDDFSRKSARVAEIFLWHMQNKKPFVTLKVALSADGKIAGPPGTSTAITSQAAQLRGRELRATYDATLVGAETFIKDNPLLDFRETAWEGKKDPKVVILDPRGRAQIFFAQSRMAKVIKKENVFFVTTVSEVMLSDLYQKGIFSLYVEGGAKTHELFIQQKLFQKVICFISPRERPGGLSWVWTPEQIASKLSQRESVLIAEDKFIEYDPVK